MVEKRHLTLLVDGTIVERARQQGVNLSRFFENQLEEFVNFTTSNRDRNLKQNLHNTDKVQGMGFEPTYPYGTRPSIWRL